MPPEAIYDLHRLPEESRLKVIAETAAINPGKIVGIIVENKWKGERYLAKIQEWWTCIELVSLEELEFGDVKEWVLKIKRKGS